jgi:hypothetical protein
MDSDSEYCEEECGRYASLECTNCNAYFCDDCFATSHQTNVMKRHQYGPIGKGSKKCVQHSDQRLDMYCMTCQQIVCIKCLFTRQHKNHDSVTIDEFAKSKLAELKIIENRLNDKLVKYTTISKEYEMAKQSLRNVHLGINESINSSFDRIIILAKTRKENLLKESAKVEHEKRKTSIIDLTIQKWMIWSENGTPLAIQRANYALLALLSIMS